jgi:hypothetical protein
MRARRSLKKFLIEISNGPADILAACWSGSTALSTSPPEAFVIRGFCIADNASFVDILRLSEAGKRCYSPETTGSTLEDDMRGIGDGILVPRITQLTSIRTPGLRCCEAA